MKKIRQELPVLFSDLSVFEEVNYGRNERAVERVPPSTPPPPTGRCPPPPPFRFPKTGTVPFGPLPSTFSAAPVDAVAGKGTRAVRQTTSSSVCSAFSSVWRPPSSAFWLRSCSLSPFHIRYGRSNRERVNAEELAA
ncbi:hypothetical protein R1flu_020443 [Riccia fluitans]|uniref:Uncharacterized protein n=1 Tax=Riccia fluitans TaxID=41844 RepID=A0ABD1ZLX0_9MARC